MNRTLITGTNGFLASRLIDYVDGQCFGISRSDNFKTTKKERYTTLYGDVLDYQFVCRAISDNEITHIYHLAAQSIVRIANTNPLSCLQSNIIGTANVLEAVRQINPKIKVVASSSDKSYGEQEILPYTENMSMQAGGVYSTSKACADLICQSYAKSYNIDVSIVRCANIYGHGDMNLSRLIPNTIIQILNNKKPVIYSDVLNYRREFIFVDDVCSAYVLLSEKGEKGQAYNVGTGGVYRIGDVVEIICKKMNWHDGVNIIPKSFSEITTQYLCSEKIRKLGWKPDIDLSLGLEKAIDWYANKFKIINNL